jgi:hypothetical protein
MAQQQLHALVVNLLCAFHVVLPLEIWKLFGEALLVQVLFSVAGLMLDDMVGNLDVFETSLLARSVNSGFVARVKTVLV